MKRKQISKRLRFELFKRDSFTCVYCGSSSPNVKLEIDHIIPVSKGGVDSMDNLVTSCFGCNRGKSNVELTSIPLSISEKHQISRDIESQYKEYTKHIKSVINRENNEIDEVELIFSQIYIGLGFTDKFRLSVKNFISKIGIYEVKNAMEKACWRSLDSDDALKYFCGICWNKIKGQ